MNAAFDSSQLVQIGVIVLILVVAWIVLRTVLRLTIRIFSLGCGAILVLAVILYILRYLGSR